MKFFKYYRFETILLYFLILYVIIRDVFSGEIVYSDRFILWSFQGFIFPFFIVTIIRNYNKKKVSNKNINLFNMIYWTVFVASIGTVLLLFNKSFDTFYQSVQVDDLDRYMSFDMRYRAYGISENLTFTYSFVAGLFSGYSLLVLEKRKYLFIPMLLALVAVAFNARIGFVAIIILIAIAMLKFKFKNFRILFLYILLGIFLMMNFFSEYMETLLANKNWVLFFFRDISDTLFGTHFNDSGVSTIGILTGEFIVLPKTLMSWIFGTGKSLFIGVENNTDIGYLLQLNYGGLILLMILFLLMFVITYRLYKNFGSSFWYFYFLPISILILNFKGFIFAGTPGGRVLFFLYVYFIYDKKSKVENLIEND